MPLSLLTIRTRLKPLTWLLGLALLLSASPHLAQGLVLCIGEDHVEVEASGAKHHAGGGEENTASARAPDASAVPAEGLGALLHERGAACIDVPLRATRGSDLCHQAVTNAQERTDALSGALLAAAVLPFLEEQAARETPPVYPHSVSAAEATSPLRTLSSVVLLI